jgi:hypothetical protein
MSATEETNPAHRQRMEEAAKGLEIVAWLVAAVGVRQSRRGTADIDKALKALWDHAELGRALPVLRGAIFGTTQRDTGEEPYPYLRRQVIKSVTNSTQSIRIVEFEEHTDDPDAAPERRWHIEWIEMQPNVLKTVKSHVFPYRVAGDY